MNKKWIWQSKNYPNFLYDEKEIQPLLDEIYQNEKKLEKIILNNDLNKIFLEAKVKSLENEIINSADIEGETLKRESVRASLRKRLDENFGFFNKHITKQSDNYATLLLEAISNKKPLNLQRLHGWHNCLFEFGYAGLYKINVAKFRDDEMQIVSGGIGKEKIHYEAPLAKDVDKNMQAFLEYCNNNSTNAYIKSAVAHLYFVVIHPYDDGNGRLARIISNFLLPNQNVASFYSLSTQINKHKKEYYEVLEKTTRFNEKCDISHWLSWHLKMTNLAFKNALKEFDKIIFKTKFWDNFKELNLNANQQKFLNKILDIGANDFKGHLNANKYATITKVSLDIAKKEFAELYQFGCLVKNDSNLLELLHDFKITQTYDPNDSSAMDMFGKEHFEAEEKAKQENKNQAENKEGSNRARKNR